LAYTPLVPKHAFVDACRKWYITISGGWVDCKIMYGRNNIDPKICCNNNENMPLFIYFISEDYFNLKLLQIIILF